MWSADNSIGGGGGGFLDQTYEGQSSQTKDKSDPIRGNAIVPVMIEHLLDQTPDNLNLWGTPIKLVCVVGWVRKFERASTKISYELVDETGSIMAFQWIESGNEESHTAIPIGKYARVIGSPRQHDNTRHIFSLKIVPIPSYIDVFEHLLEVTYVCLRGKELLGNPPPATAGNSMAMDVKETADTDSCHGMTKEQVIVFKTVKAQNETGTGIERNELKTKVPPSLSNQVDEILDFLVSEGHIYTTCTDDHFKTT